MGKIKGFLFAVRHREILMTDLGLRLLFHNMKVEDIDAKADIFFVRMLSLNDDIRAYIESLPKGNYLTKAIERKMRKQ